MKSFFKKKVSLFVALLLLNGYAFAQYANSLQLLSKVSQSSQVNPAFQNKTDKLIVGLPAIGGTSINWNTNFTINNFKTSNFNFDFNHFYETLNTTGEIFSTAQTPIIFLSLKTRKQTLSLSISEKFFGTIRFNPEFLNFFAQGLIPYYGNDKTIGSISANANYYREVALGYSREINKKFQVGIRTKTLFGKFFYDANNISITTETIAEEEKLLVRPKGLVTVHGPLTLTTNSKGTKSVKPDIKSTDYSFRPKNMGAAVDIGLNYQMNKHVKLSFSVLDVGFISLYHKTYAVSLNKPIHYIKDSLYQSHSPQESRYWAPKYAVQGMNDSIPSISSADEIGKRKFQALPLQVNGSIKYQLSNGLQVGIANYFMHYNSYSSNVFSGFMYYLLKERIELTTMLSLYNLQKVMPGIALSYTGKHIQYYFSTNNILGVIQPTSAKNLNLCFGINFLFSTH